ncbi:MAG: HEAT repeat domain-containing protein [Candidatus Nanopelagicales bacterium]
MFSSTMPVGVAKALGAERTMLCPVCALDQEPRAGAQTCPRCGTLIPESPTQEPASSPQNEPQQKQSPRRPSGKWRIPLVVVGSVGVILLIYGVLAVLTRLLAPDVASLASKGDLPGLTSALTYKDDPVIRADAATALGATGSPDALGPLLSARHDTDSTVAAAAAKATMTLLTSLPDDQATTRLIALAATDDPVIRADAATALGATGSLDALAPLLSAWHDTDSTVAAAASNATKTLLTSLPDDKATLRLIELAAIEAGPWSQSAKWQLPVYIDALGAARALRASFAVQSDSRKEVSTAAEKAITQVLSRRSRSGDVTLLLDLTKSKDRGISQRASQRLTKYLIGLGIKPAAKAVMAAKAGDTWLAVALQVDKPQLSAETRRRNLQLDKLDWIMKQASGASKGRKVGGSHPYAPGRGFHPVIVIDKDYLGYGWKAGTPTALRFLELVAVASEDTQVVQRCNYTDNMRVTRHRSVVTVKLYSAKNAKLITTRAFRGGTPGRCEKTIWGIPGDKSMSIDGSKPKIKRWLNSIVHAP